jgi:hypothetical protein
MNAAGDQSVEAERLLKRDSEWAALASAGRDVDRILSYWTDDAVVLGAAVGPGIGRCLLNNSEPPRQGLIWYCVGCV